MELIKKHGIVLFALLLVMHGLFIYFGKEEPRTFSKLLLMPLLALYLYASAKKLNRQKNLPAFAGLFFAFLGDLLLTQKGESFFLLGMLAFIGTHICYSLYFLTLQKLDFSRGKPMLLAALALLILSSEVMHLTGDSLGSFKVPILLYMVIIGAMTVFATNTIHHTATKQLTIQYFIPGAGLFVLSDSILALNLFVYHEVWLDIAVMLTYGTAQCLLVLGFSKR
ncbi:MAG: lysoplasmalogenase [Sediminibacterium sp.]|nr:lysoplasmalogenase [Sediminibacterium sp.]MDP1812480.1 lysoplasmalogenase [Sediminibacterium sp.]MDP3129272.1 lysoplasmalogenase [Sediminibacterium sp.]MDP3667837.1 lysoplasmalogenase [Sediminibacterium sp.]